MHTCKRLELRGFAAVPTAHFRPPRQPRPGLFLECALADATEAKPYPRAMQLHLSPAPKTFQSYLGRKVGEQR